jgi:hypothetical protein
VPETDEEIEKIALEIALAQEFDHPHIMRTYAFTMVRRGGQPVDPYAAHEALGLGLGLDAQQALRAEQLRAQGGGGAVPASNPMGKLPGQQAARTHAAPQTAAVPGTASAPHAHTHTLPAPNAKVPCHCSIPLPPPPPRPNRAGRHRSGGGPAAMLCQGGQQSGAEVWAGQFNLGIERASRGWGWGRGEEPGQRTGAGTTS